MAKETGNETIRIVGEDDDEETSGVNWTARSIMGSLVDFSINANELDRLVDDNV
ncbi:MAG: hypothetical protein OXC82_08780 [Rhodobacteraceae bacterium]|nr:hypothetical protein [Paracoccaceae bacterium]MCY4250509.1 hypothetical protein [Paracoccaceae bacterium]MCY4308129.1 hypothetical protein [Paracoccaceae bacterium]